MKGFYVLIFYLSLSVLLINNGLSYVEGDSAVSTVGHYCKDGSRICEREMGREVMDVKEYRARQKREVFTIVVMVVSAVVKIAGKIMERKHAEEAAKRYKETMKFKLEQLCDAICVTEWSNWSSCTKQCGNGKRERTRQHQLPGKCTTLEKFTCRHSVKQEEWCNMGCPHGGTPSQHGCLCRPGYHGNCCQFETECEYPGRPRHGEVSGVFPAGFRSVATFSCAPGYTMEGSEAVVCLADGQWSDTTPQCRAIICSADPPNNNVRVLNPRVDYLWGEEIHYTCNPGYVMRGPAARSCTQQHGVVRWTGFNPLCEVVQCDPPVAPLNGYKEGSNHRYGDHVTFHCNQGFQLIGSPRITCSETGKWIGNVPTCDVISCDPPLVPKHGSVMSRSTRYSSLVVFSCDDGYVLEGSAVLQCGDTGNWNGTEPRCKAAICGNPGVPHHGYKDGSTYYYPHALRFGCHAGYTRQGPDSITCQRNGTWDGSTPTCHGCPVSTYMDMEREPGTCTPCPPNSHTLTEASTHKQQCVCNDNYTGPAGGPCIEIRCPPLSPPVQGRISCTGNMVNNYCNISCDPGHVIEQGTNRRVCMKDGSWTGVDVVCSSCPLNTFQSEERICVPCPPHSHTTEEGNIRSGCTCDDGFSGPPGGPCTDINECTTNNGRGPCEDLCENLVGGYRCSCFVPGYEVTQSDPHKCIVVKQCNNLTTEEAPVNGGLVCHWYHEENSQQCSVKCNRGYEFPSRSNDYEYCGPPTGYIWSYQQDDPEAIIEPCIEEFFPEFRLNADSSYFVTDCQSLTEEEQLRVKEEFVQVLNRNGVCKKKATLVCDIANIAIICGRRSKRSLFNESTVDLLFDLKAIKFEDQPKNCDQICTFLKIPMDFCPKLCVTAYKRFLQASLIYARDQLSDLFRNRTHSIQTLKFNVGQRTFEPESITTSDVIIQCDAGMVDQDGACVPCSSGTYYNSTTQQCRPCPLGTYNPLEGQTECFRCPNGSTTYFNGSAMCEECRDGTYGEKCEQRCHCVHGNCDKVSGECVCTSGWGGPNCNIDVPGCVGNACADDMRCVDIRAPGTGYRCTSS